MSSKTPSHSQGFSLFELLRSNRRAQLGLGVLGAFFALALIGPLFVDDAAAYVAIPYLEPSLGHLFGTSFGILGSDAPAVVVPP